VINSYLHRRAIAFSKSNTNHTAIAKELTPSLLIMSKDQYLAGKLAIVTGAGKANGIGAATAYTLASHGANVSNN
jgi:D-arabinose 5-phosphate isomerase GutQ